jgi:hypothetical protein
MTVAALATLTLLVALSGLKGLVRDALTNAGEDR